MVLTEISSGLVMEYGQRRTKDNRLGPEHASE